MRVDQGRSPGTRRHAIPPLLTLAWEAVQAKRTFNTKGRGVLLMTQDRESSEP